MILPTIKRFSQKGFTLIELLIVMAILGILAVGLVAAINPTEKINAANDSKTQSDIGVLARASESYATSRNGFYPLVITDLTGSNEIKFAPASVPNDNAHFTSCTGLPGAACGAACTAGSSCARLFIAAPLLSSKFTSTCSGGNVPYWVYTSETGKTCYKCAATPITNSILTGFTGTTNAGNGTAVGQC